MDIFLVCERSSIVCLKSSIFSIRTGTMNVVLQQYEMNDDRKPRLFPLLQRISLLVVMMMMMVRRKKTIEENSGNDGDVQQYIVIFTWKGT